LRGANERLKNNFLTSIKMFTGLIELRDSKLAGHSRRVAELSRRLAQALALNNRETQEIFVSGLLHAIGKVGFADELLSTPVASMTPRQLDTYRKHPARAEQLLMPLGELKGAVDIIGAQLELHDGSGYPQGLSGRHIPLGARILAVASDYCGLLVGRLESKPFTQQQARDYIRQHRSYRYDPAVVDVFVELNFIAEQDGVNTLPQGTRTVTSKDFKAGMVLMRDFSSPSGLLLLTAGHVLDDAVIQKIRSFERTIDTCLSAEVQVPAQGDGPEQGTEPLR
jgi:response regulator RpfG family c-di-GMP phosphodiesterase